MKPSDRPFTTPLIKSKPLWFWTIYSAIALGTFALALTLNLDSRLTWTATLAAGILAGFKGYALINQLAQQITDAIAKKKL
jgi:hypothetical protein